MTILADSFLGDLELLSDNEEELFDGLEKDKKLDFDDGKTPLIDDLESVSRLHTTRRFADIMNKIENSSPQSSSSPEECNYLCVDIDKEIVAIHNFIRDKYRLKFPKLESLVPHPVDYARIVKKISNETDLTLVDFEGLLPSAVIMVVSTTASTTTGTPLPEHILQKTISACDRVLDLDSAKKRVLDFIESRTTHIAPNLSAIVGTAVAAKLMGAAGGLSALAQMPSCNVLLLGSGGKRKSLAGFSSATTRIRAGFIEQTELFQSTPPSLRMQVCRKIATKSTLAARVDSVGGDPTGKTGREMSEEIRKKIEKLQELPPARQPKPLPVPDMNPKKKRGGRRMRKMKERYEVTDMRKLVNRMQFGVSEESSLGDGLGEGYGMLGQAGNGKLRVSLAQRSKPPPAAANKLRVRGCYGGGNSLGAASSLAFTPVQGIELVNPHANQVAGGMQSTYFSLTGTFSKFK